MTRTLLPEIHSAETRQALAESVLAVLERALKSAYPDDPASRQAWLMLPDAELDDQPPLRAMLGGVEGIKRVRKHIEVRT
jgi:hypothetical protein